MESYLMMLYVTIEQESALKNFFVDKGWQFCKPDLTITTDELGPSVKDVANENSTSTILIGNSRVTRKRRGNVLNDTASAAKLLKNNPSPQNNKQNVPVCSCLQVESENISEIGKLIESGMQDAISSNLTVPEFTGSKVKHDKFYFSNNESNEDLVHSDDDESSGVAYNHEEVRDEIKDVVKEIPVVKSGHEMVVTWKEDDQKREPKICKTRDASTMIVDDERNQMCITCQHFEKQAMILDKGPSISEKGTGELKTYVCDVCGKLFIHLSTYKRHVRSHEIAALGKNEREKKWKCKECEKVFGSEGNLREHVHHVHLKKPGEYMCHLCPKSYTRSSRLEGHLNSHYGIKPYTCKSCNLAFYAKSTFIEHQKKCEGGVIVRHKCQMCSEKFGSQNELKQHRTLEHANVFCSAPCGRKIRWKSSLKKHTSTCQKCQDIDMANKIISGI